MKAGLYQHEVVEVTGTEPGVVGQVGVARAHLVTRYHFEEVLDRFRHGVDVAWRAGNGLRQHIAVDVEDTGGNVAALAHDGAEGSVHQCLRLFVDDRHEAVPHDLEFDPGWFSGHGLPPVRCAWR